MSTRTLAVPLLLTGVLIAVSEAADHGNFAQLPDPQKEKIVWDLVESREFGKPEHKPLCRELLATQGRFANANATSFTMAALDAAQKHGWRDLGELVKAIYERPRSIWLYERSFRCLRALSGKPIPAEVVAAAQTLHRGGWRESPVSNKELESAKGELIRKGDEEITLVYALFVACQDSGKGGTDRGRHAAAEVLRALPRRKVRATLGVFRESFDLLWRPLIPE